MTRTAALVRAIREELERRRTDDIDGDMGLRSVTLVVSFDQKTGAPREILFRKESRAGIRQVPIALSKKMSEYKVG